MLEEKLEAMDKRSLELEELIQKPETLKNPAMYAQYGKEHGGLTRIVSVYRDYKKVKEQIKSTAELAAQDAEFKELAQEELIQLNKRKEQLFKDIENMLISDDESEKRNIIVEIRAGTGGEEASLFARDLFLMYTKFAEKKHWKVEILDSSATDLGGFKEVSLSVKGKGAYSMMQHETGGHRVQRIPVTESNGRIHTSACTVAVLPEVEEVEVEIKPEEIQIDFKRASGPGGQNVNKTSSAVRLTHLPTGIIVNCQETPEQHKNRAKALRILRAKLYQKYQDDQRAEMNALRKSQGSGERSDRVRTYNYPQSRITDHRIGLSVYNLENFMLGDIDDIINGLQKYDRERKLAVLHGIQFKPTAVSDADRD